MIYLRLFFYAIIVVSMGSAIYGLARLINFIADGEEEPYDVCD